jgi:hypothetical protein
MESVVWNKERILFIECLENGAKIKTSCYISLLDKVKQAMVSINGRGSCKNNCFFLQDNISSNMAVITQHKLADVNSEVMKHPAYSPHLAPSGCHVCCRQVCSPTFQNSIWMVKRNCSSRVKRALNSGAEG